MALRRGLANQPQNAVAQSTTIRAAHGGMDGRVGLADANSDIAIYTYNLVADEYGMKLRSGYGEYCIGLDSGGSAATGVKTLIPFESATGNTADDRLFAVTNEGIWDVTTYNSPTLAYTFVSAGGDAGNGQFIQYNTDAGAQLIFYADPENGLHVYTQSTDTWAVNAGFTGLAAVDVVGVTVHKQRIWFVKKDSGDAFYLGIGAIAGAATQFQFGNKFKRGGKLVGLYNWTLDGGTGVDDYLVGISSAGDVIPYQGSDPEATTGNLWEQRGVYFIGETVGGVKCATEFGGDLHILSSFGVTPLSTLIRGQDAAEPSEGIGAKTAYYLRQDITRLTTNGLGWGIYFLPSRGNVVINTPVRNTSEYIQYAYDVNRETFGWWRGVPAVTFTEWQNKVYIGTADNRVLSFDQDIDDRRITPENPQNGFPIEFSSLFAFSALDAGGRFKRGAMIRPDFLSSRPISYQAKFAYDFAIATFSTQVSQNGEAEATWDTSLWDMAVWGSSELVNRSRVVGGVGMGRTLAVAIQGSGVTDTYLMSYDIIWDTGGML